MAATPRVKGSKQAAPQNGVQRDAASVPRRPLALHEITLTEEEAAELERIMARPSTLRPGYVPRPVPEADPSFLD
jgi:hypothetical protein